MVNTRGDGSAEAERAPAEQGNVLPREKTEATKNEDVFATDLQTQDVRHHSAVDKVRGDAALQGGGLEKVHEQQRAALDVDPQEAAASRQATFDANPGAAANRAS